MNKSSASSNSWFRTIRRYFFNGLLFVLPIGLTIWFLVYLVTSIERLLRNLLHFFIGDSAIGQAIVAQYRFGFAIIVTIILLIVIGWLVRNVFGRLIRRWVDRIFESVPLVNKIYHFVRQVTRSLGKGGGSAFKRVVLVDYPHPGTKAIGFVSNENMSALLGEENSRDKIAVFVPTSPNPTSGFVIVVDTADTIPLKMTVEEGLQFIISGGTLDVCKDETGADCEDGED